MIFFFFFFFQAEDGIRDKLVTGVQTCALPISDRHPERGVQARDRVLTQMLENKYITAEDVQDAKVAPLKIIRTSISGSEAPYFVDMVKDHLLDKYSENELLSENFRVYTTLDPALQRAAAA